MRESFCLQRREQGDVWWCQQMKKGEYFFPCNRQVGCRNHYHVTSSTASFQRGLKVEKIQCSLRASRVVLRIVRSWKESQPCAVGRVEGFSTSQNPRWSLNIERQAAQHLSAWHTCGWVNTMTNTAWHLLCGSVELLFEQPQQWEKERVCTNGLRKQLALWPRLNVLPETFLKLLLCLAVRKFFSRLVYICFLFLFLRCSYRYSVSYSQPRQAYLTLSFFDRPNYLTFDALLCSCSFFLSINFV